LPSNCFYLGTSIVNAQTLYPFLWSWAPAGWKTGANLTLPDADGKVLRVDNSGGTIGVAGGADTVTLVANNIPAHAHPAGTFAVDPASFNVALPDHVHAATGLTVNPAAFNVTLPNHVHTNAHTHTTTAAARYNLVDNGAVGGAPNGGGTNAWTAGNSVNTGGASANTGNPTTNPNISIDVPSTAVSGSTGDPTTNPNIAINVPSTAVTGTSGNNTTTGAAVNIVPSHITVRAYMYAGEPAA